MRTALADLRLDALYVVYPGNRTSARAGAEKMKMMPLTRFAARPDAG